MRIPWNKIAPWAAPALLLGIASAQFAFAHFSTLSPWKGGGFGMFSTVDSPGARFLRIHLLTDRGEIPVAVPDGFHAAARELRTTGSEARAAELARSLAAGTWVRLRIASPVQRYRHLLSTSRLAESSVGGADDGVIDLGKLNFVRMLKPNETVGTDDTALRVVAVRIEVWKYAFDPNNTSLHAEKFLDVSFRRG